MWNIIKTLFSNKIYVNKGTILKAKNDYYVNSDDICVVIRLKGIPYNYYVKILDSQWEYNIGRYYYVNKFSKKDWSVVKW